MSLTSRALRLACDVDRPDAVLDSRTNLAPTALRGASLAFQLAAFLDDTLLEELSTVVSLTLLVRDVNDDGTLGAVRLSKTIAGDQLTPCTIEQWRDGTGQHAEITATKDELNLEGGNKHLSVYADLDNDGRVFWAHGKFTILDVGATDDPPVNPPEIYLTQSEADARYPRRSAENAAYRFKDDGDGGLLLQLKNGTTGKFHTVFITGDEGAETLAIGPGES